MKSVPVLLLVFVIMVQTMHQSIVYLGYDLNKEYITDKFCENKYNPRLDCHGKCHLKRELLNTNQEQEKIPSVKPVFDFMVNNWSDSRIDLFVFSFSPVVWVHGCRDHTSPFLALVLQPPRQA